MSVAATVERVNEPVRTACAECGELVLAVVIPGEQIVVAEPFEWEPRARCYVCSFIESRVKACPVCGGTSRSCRRCGGAGAVTGSRANCDRCGGEGYVGQERPEGPMLAIDIAWSDDGHVRLIGPKTDRKRGEALYELHGCDSRVIMPAPETRSRKVAA